MQANKKIFLTRVSDATEAHSTKRNKLIRDLNFFAFRLNTWFVFVEDLGEEAEKKDEQLSLF
ncbi:hypothetical protein [Vibrio campbellii]|uniref:hypothetical protein n=1 Tax=Vibrio campbellii TaxID=680 RepID=UPI001F1FCA4E|nr:hypothetical protein [Vibrio campbellii]MCE7729640.1 hypothetical protein [Vibrio campbellii]